MKKFFLTVCCLVVASVAMAQSDTVANVKNVYVTQDADRGRIPIDGRRLSGGTDFADTA